MLKFVDTALIDADVILYVTDVIENPEKNKDYIERIRKSNMPVIVLINKIDLSNQEKVLELYGYWSRIFPGADVFPISALERFNISPIFTRLLELLPESPPFFGKDDLTDRNERFFMQEIIREKVLLHYQKEVPYSVEVEVEEFKEESAMFRIRAIIYVARESQKGIIIGHKGEALKQVGIEARKDAEEFFGKKIFLELYVKVAKEWRDAEKQLKKFGYDAY
jgi:GTP-binding protein Era